MSLTRLNNKEFDSAEHKSLGNVTLPGLPKDFNKFLFQPGGAKLSFGEIIALAGDYFGVAEEPIALGETKEERRRRFLAHYATLANCPDKKVYALTTEFVKEEVVAKDAMAQGKDEADAMDKITVEETKIALDSTDHHYLHLSLHNLDHFGEYAHIAYDTGYDLAMETVVKAAELTDSDAQQKMLEYAYTLYAFGCHFGTDLFAAGHMRTPTGPLREKFGAEIGSTLTFFQHNDDGDLGLNVQASDSRWKAYGDGHLFEKESMENQARALATVQAGVNEIYNAFLTKKAIPANESQAKKMIPVPCEDNHAPMFKVEENKLMCRVPLGKAPDQNSRYEELTLFKALEILALHGEQVAHKALVDKIEACKKKLNIEIERLGSSKKANNLNEHTSLVEYSMFTKRDLVDASLNKSFELALDSEDDRKCLPCNWF